MMNFLEKILETTNFFLEPITVQHAIVLFDLLKPKQLYTFIPANAPKTMEVLKAKYEMLQKRYSPNKNEIWLNYAILDKKDKCYKGTVQATVIKNAETYIAYEVFPEYWKKGIAKECVSELVNFLFSKFECEKITAHIDTRNVASLKLLESLKFKCVKRINDADFFKETKSDEFVYELELYKIKTK